MVGRSECRKGCAASPPRFFSRRIGPICDVSCPVLIFGLVAWVFSWRTTETDPPAPICGEAQGIRGIGEPRREGDELFDIGCDARDAEEEGCGVGFRAMGFASGPGLFASGYEYGAWTAGIMWVMYGWPPMKNPQNGIACVSGIGTLRGTSGGCQVLKFGPFAAELPGFVVGFGWNKVVIGAKALGNCGAILNPYGILRGEGFRGTGPGVWGGWLWLRWTGDHE